jgi:hypothetical protein
MVVETRYMRTVLHTVAGIRGYKLDTVQGTDCLSRNVEFEGDVQIFFGIRVWVVGPHEKEDVMKRYGIKNKRIEIIHLKRRSAVMVRVYVWRKGGNPIPLETFITEPLNASKLDTSTWKVFYWTSRKYDPKRNVTEASFRFGNSVYNSRIENFAWTPLPC